MSSLEKRLALVRGTQRNVSRATRISLARLLTLVGFFAGLVSVAAADTYPSRSIRLIVPFGPGGSGDAIARPLAEKLGAALQQTVIVDNRPGGLTVVGADFVAKAPADGYTLFLMPGTHVLTPYLVKTVPYDPIKDFTPIALIGTQAYVLSTNVQQPFNSMAELMTYAKANPGRVSVGLSDLGTLVIASNLQTRAGVELNVVNYKGAGPTITDLLGNQITLALTTPAIMPHVNAKTLRALAVTSPTRLPFMPDTPTIAEFFAGSNFDVQTWYAIAAPANVPKDIVQKLHDALAKVLVSPDMAKRLLDIAVVVPADTGPEALGRYMRSYQERIGKLVQAAGVKPE